MIECYGATDVGCVRKSNEDAFAMETDLGLFVVADGMGGARAGERASRIAVETVVELVREAAPSRTIEGLLQAVGMANRNILRQASEDPELQGMGTTVVAVLVEESVAHVASVGDSRLYVWRDGQLRRVTSDQTWVNEVGRGLGLTDEQIRTHPFRHVLTMAVGVRETVVVRSHQVRLEPGDLMLLSTDGLHGVIQEASIAGTLASDSTLAEKTARLIQIARGQGGPDNITAVLVRPKGQEAGGGSQRTDATTGV